MWWPALGAVAVGVIGYFYPDTLGVGYYNIRSILDQNLALRVVIMLCLMKFLSWSISLGSGTSGGTLAPLLTIGAGCGQVLGAAAMWCLPFAGIDLRLAALVGMAATFAGASRAFLASAVFAYETTCQPHGLLPLLAGCAASYLVASLVSKHSIMTEKIARRGIRTPADYVPDPLEQVTVAEIASQPVVTLQADDSVTTARTWLASNVEAARHQGFPLVDARGYLVGVLTRRDLQAETAQDGTPLRELLTRPLKFVYDDCTVRQAADHMVNHNIGRLPVVRRDQPTQLIGIVTRSDILSTYRRRIKQDETQRPAIRVSRLSKSIRRIPTRTFPLKSVPVAANLFSRILPTVVADLPTINSARPRSGKLVPEPKHLSRQTMQRGASTIGRSGTRFALSTVGIPSVSVSPCCTATSESPP